MPTNQVYSIYRTAKLLHCGTQTLRTYIDRGWLKVQPAYHGKKQYHTIDQKQFEQLKKLFDPDPNLITVKDFAKANSLPKITVTEFIQKHHIQDHTPKLVPEQVRLQSYYVKADLETIHSYLKRTNQKTKYFNAADLHPQNTRWFNKQSDYTIYTLGKFLKPAHPVTQRIIIQWIQTERVPYSMDAHEKIYFTKQQAQKIKARYQQIPAEIDCNTQELAKRLHTTHDKISSFCKPRFIEPIKILGYQEVFYTYQQTHLIETNWSKRKLPHRKEAQS